MSEINNTGTNKWYEVDASNTAPSPDGWANGTYFNQVEPIGRATMGAIKRFWDRINGTVVSTGSSNAYVYTPVNTSYPIAYVQGETYSFKANFTNTGAATLNINGLGATSLYKQGASGPTALIGGEIQSGQMVSVQYDGANFQIISQIPVLFSSVAITGGTINGTTIGATTASTGKFTTLEATGAASLDAGGTLNGTFAGGGTTHITQTYLDSCQLDGNTAGTTASPGDNSTKVATTAFVQAFVPLMSPLGVGSILTAVHTGNVGATGTVAAATLTAYSCDGSSATGDSLSGTWKALQNTLSTKVGLWQRIA